MKQIHIVFVVSMSFAGLSAMSPRPTAHDLNLRPLFDAPYIAKWQKICKDPQEKRKLVTVYQDFCQKRFRNAIPWTMAGWTFCAAVYTYRQGLPFGQKTIISGSLAYLFALRQTYLLGRNCYRADLASQGNLYYLNNDIWEQLGHPEVYKRNISKNYWYGIKLIGDPYRESQYRINNVSDIERALSGKHPEGLDKK